ncbi:MAG: tetratricopeptide repeat protein [Nitrospinae bacterium]|nr:tetratricopeptide repeat protein [Nitrospinota bacterium]
MNNPEARIKALEGRLEQYPSSAAFFPLASLLLEKDEVEQAENLLKSGLATYPNYAAAGVLLGEILISKNEHEQASRFLIKALEIAPWNISAQRLLAECHAKEGDEVDAQVALRAVNMFETDEVAPQSLSSDVEIDSAPVVGPEEESGEVATPALAELYIAQGHLDKAKDVYERLLKSEPAKVEWNERIAAIREQISQYENVDASTGYPGTEENLDFIAGEVKGEADMPAEAKPDVVTSEEMVSDESCAETSSANFEGPGKDLSLTDKASAVDKEGGEPSVIPARDVDSEEVDDTILQKIIELYIQEENESQALEICRKALILGENTSWILEKISALERKAEESTAPLLRNEVEEDKDRSTPVLSLADESVVQTLEGWLETLHRRKANA